MAQGTIIRSNARAKPPTNKKTNANPNPKIKPGRVVPTPLNVADIVNQATYMSEARLTLAAYPVTRRARSLRHKLPTILATFSICRYSLEKYSFSGN
jgi:hypothetical protein